MTSWPWHIHFSKTFAKETIRIKFSYINSWTSSSLQGCVDMTMLHFFSCWHTFGCPLSSSATAVWFLLMNDSVCRLSERYHLHNFCFSPAAGSWDDAPHLYEQLPAVQWDQWAGGPSFCPLHRNARKTCSVPQVFANHCEGWYKICKEMSGQSHDRGLFLLFVLNNCSHSSNWLFKFNMWQIVITNHNISCLVFTELEKMRILAHYTKNQL